MLVEAQASAPGVGMKGMLRRRRSISSKKATIPRRELDAQRGPKRAEAECTQVLVEVAQPRRQGERLNARCCGAFGQGCERHVACGVGVARDVDPRAADAESAGLRQRHRESL